MSAQSISTQQITQQYWRRTFAATLLVFVYALSYTLLYSSNFSILPVVTAIALTGGLLIGLSFALSGICFYTNIFDKTIIYRKYFGLVGYYLALLYSVLLIFIYPDLYGPGLLFRWYEPEVLLGLLAMTILSLMTISSNVKVIRMLGSKRWHLIMSMGYVAYALLICRAIVLEHEIWLGWLLHPGGLPPPRLMLSTYALVVILLRLSIPIAKQLRKRAAV